MTATMTEGTKLHRGRLVSRRESLVCPRCGSERTALTSVGLQARFDGDGSEPEAIGLDVTGFTIAPPEGMVHSEQRTAIALHGACERGHEFTVSFVQEGAVTEVHAWHREA